MNGTAKLALAAATTVCLWVGICLPHATPWPAKADWDYFVPAANFDDELQYVTTLNRFLRTGRLPGNPYILEHEADPYMQPAYNQAVLGLLCKPFGPRFRLLYVWIALLFAAGLVAVTRSLLLTLDVPEEAVGLGCFLMAAGLQPNMNRMIHPQADAFLLLCLCVLALRRIHLAPGAAVVPAAWGGVCAGLLPYLYPFHALYLYVLTPLLAGLAILRRDRRAFAAYSLFLGAAFLVVVPYVNHSLQLSHLPNYGEIQQRIGFLLTHWPALLRTALLLAASVLLVPLLPMGERGFFLAAFGAGLICVNQHVLTGLYLTMTGEHFRHAYRLMVCLAAMAALARVAPVFLRRRGVLLTALAGTAFLVSQGVLAGSPERRALQAKVAAYAPALSWINANASVDDVAIASDPTESLIAGFTTSRPFTNVYAFVSVATQRELRDRKFAELKVFGLRPEGFRDYANGHYLSLWGFGPMSLTSHRRAENVGRKLLGLAPLPVNGDPVSKEDLDQADSEYRAFSSPTPFLGYRANYLLYGPWEQELFPDFNPGAAGLGEPVFSDENLRLWRIGPNRTDNDP